MYSFTQFPKLQKFLFCGCEAENENMVENEFTDKRVEPVTSCFYSVRTTSNRQTMEY